MAERVPRFTPGISQADLIRGYQRLGSMAPFTKEDLQGAYQPYSKFGIAFGKVNGKTDSALYKMAGDAVVRWFKAEEAKKAAAKAAGKAAPAAAPKPKAPTPKPTTGTYQPSYRPAAPTRQTIRQRPSGTGAGGVRPI